MISVIIPIYNRPGEAQEILESLSAQSEKGFEVIVIEDGSQLDCRSVCESYSDKLNIQYLTKENGGPALARNFGAARAKGDFLVIMDSDCVAPPHYIATISKAIEHSVRFFGGPDMAQQNFSAMQRAVSYSMTSLFTTGGIRGGKKKVSAFIPRSFNMGVETELFNAVGGFSDMRFGEDMDFSMRIIELGVRADLLLGAGLYHKRRTNLKSFFRQVYFSGIARVNLTRRHPGSLKLVHLLPTAFTLGVLLCIILAFFSPIFLLPIAAIASIWFIDSSLRNRSLKVGVLSILTSFVQLLGYGTGFLSGIWQRSILHRSEAESYKTNFF